MLRNINTNKIVVGFLGIAGVAFFGGTVYKKVMGMVAAPFKDATDAVNDTVIAQQTGTNVATVAACRETASKIYHAFHANWFEDEDTAIRQMKNCKTAFQTRLVCQIYEEISKGRSLREDFEKYVHVTTGFNHIILSNWF